MQVSCITNLKMEVYFKSNSLFSHGVNVLISERLTSIKVSSDELQTRVKFVLKVNFTACI